MAIIGGLDIHRKQLTFEYVDTETGGLYRGRIAPADRAHLASWLRRLCVAGLPVSFAVEACTGWRYVAEELLRAGAAVYLAEPADTAAARGRKKRAKTDRTDARLLRELLEEGRLPLCFIPPSQVLECRALLELYHDLRREHTAWVQRVHAVCFHHGAPEVSGLVGTAAGRQRLAGFAATHLSPVGQLQLGTAVSVLEHLEQHLAATRRRLVGAARGLRGASLLAESIYGVGPISGLALCCWLGGGRHRSVCSRFPPRLGEHG